MDLEAERSASGNFSGDGGVNIRDCQTNVEDLHLHRNAIRKELLI